MFLFLSFSLSISVCLPVCVPLFISICQSVNQSVCLPVVGRSVVGLPELSVSHGPHEACGQRREDDESERAEGYAHKRIRLRTQERQVWLMDVELSSAPTLRTEAESRRLRARS